MEYLRKIKINPGAEVSGDDFFNREKEFISFRKRLMTIKHITISQIRRTGKTSFMKEFIARNTNLPIVYIIVQGCQNQHDFYNEIYGQIVEQSRSKKTIEFLRNGWNTIVEMAPENPYIQLGKLSDTTEEQMKKYLIKILSAKEFILFIDKFPDFILNLKKNQIAEPFLSNFRVFRNKCSKLKTVLTGSINLSRTIKTLGLADKLNGYKTFTFPLFSPENSLLFFQCLLYSEDYTLSENSIEYIFPYIEDGMPYFIQLLADEVQQLDFENKELNSENLEKAVEKVFKSEEFGLEEFHSRLDTYLKDENLEKPAKIILSHISNDELDFDDLYAFVDNHVSKERLAELLNRLEDEAYLKKENGKYSFLSKLMAGWWKEKKHFDRR